MSRPIDGTDQPVPAKKKPILLEDLKVTPQPRTGTAPEQVTELPGYPADPEFRLRGCYDNLMLDAAAQLFGLVIRL
ncbi:DotU family type IV/VI secretion system protein, partial [Pseudomonas sp. NPDC089392]